MTAEPTKIKSRAYHAFKKLYFFIAGPPTKRNILNFKYLTTYRLQRDLKKTLGNLSGSILDFGCGTKPYRPWFRHIKEYVGVDIYPGPEVDFVITGEKIPISSKTFDVVIATQVFEHTDSLHYLSELHRLLDEHGTIVISVPFLYHIHEDRDHRRFTKQGLISVLEDYGFEVIDVKIQGGIGSTLTIMKFYFIDDLVRNRFPMWLKIVMLPLMPFWLFILVPLGNILGYILDRIDNTGRFYNNLLIVGKKK